LRQMYVMKKLARENEIEYKSLSAVYMSSIVISKYSLKWKLWCLAYTSHEGIIQCKTKLSKKS
jgi:hypothetical protein